MLQTVRSNSSRGTDALPQPDRLPLTAVTFAGLHLLGKLSACLPRLRRGDEPAAASLRDLGFVHARGQRIFDFADIHPGLESARMRYLDTGPGWRGS